MFTSKRPFKLLKTNHFPFACVLFGAYNAYRKHSNNSLSFTSVSIFHSTQITSTNYWKTLSTIAQVNVWIKRSNEDPLILNKLFMHFHCPPCLFSFKSQYQEKFWLVLGSTTSFKIVALYNMLFQSISDYRKLFHAKISLLHDWKGTLLLVKSVKTQREAVILVVGVLYECLLLKVIRSSSGFHKNCWWAEEDIGRINRTGIRCGNNAQQG